MAAYIFPHSSCIWHLQQVFEKCCQSVINCGYIEIKVNRTNLSKIPLKSYNIKKKL